MFCPSCKQKAAFYFRAKDWNRRLSNERFDYYRCPACKHIFLSPIPDNLGEYYPQTYYNLTNTVTELAESAKPEQYKVDIVRRFAPGGRLLEIGPGAGGFVCLAKQAGYEVHAIEMDSRVCQFLEDVAGVRAINSADVCTALRKEKPFDVIAMWHNIEHLPDPWSAFEAAAARLVSGGVLVIAAPNPAAIQFRILRRFWVHVDAPRHLHLIPIPLLVQRGLKLGMKPVLITTRDQGTLEWNTFGWRQSLSNHINFSSKAKEVIKKAGSVIDFILRPIERSNFRGSTYTIVLKKD